MSRSVRHRRAHAARSAVRTRAARPYTCETLEARRMLAFAVPAMSSLPGAPFTLYLDFDGDPATFWSNRIGNTYFVRGPAGANDPVPAFDWDGNQNNLTASEDAALRQIHAATAEKFSPFRINVTTVDPGNVTNGVTEKVIIGGMDSDWLNEGAGGISSINGFSDATLPNTCYVFSGDAVDNAVYLGNTV